MNIDEIRKEMTREEFMKCIFEFNIDDKSQWSYFNYKNQVVKCPCVIGLKKEPCGKYYNCYTCWLESIKNIKFKGEYKLMNDISKSELHKQICEKLNQIYISKNHDYGDSFGETFNKLGIISAVTRITDKVNRLQSLCSKDALVDEKIEDTLLDLANYSIMTLIELELNKKEEEK